MKKFIAFGALGTLVTVAAIASVDGKWTGAGNMEMTGMPAMACERVELDLADTGATLEVRQLVSDCQGMHTELSPIQLEQRDGAFYLGQDRVGQRNGDSMEFSLRDPQSGATMAFVIEKVGAALQLTNELSANGFRQTLKATLHQ